jgi:hypothetical protein
MDAVAHFSRNYGQARARFLAAARARQATVETHALSGRHGIDGEELAMDVAYLGDPEAKGLLLLTSATHGIEGYCGSGAQTGFLHDPDFVGAVRDARTGVLFIHAVNPHGFSWGRRVNEDNVDLNRNFRDFTQAPPVNAAYAEIHAGLLPASWPPSQENAAEIGRWIAAHGERAFQAAVSGGQYAYSDGLFYGGAGPSWSNRTLRSVLRRHAATRTRLGWIDLHTGLGPRGHGEKIYAGRDAAADLERARAWWGAEVTSYQDGSSSSAPLTGVMYNAAYDECATAEYAGIALEYGTLTLAETFLALRADHWLHNHPEAPDSQRTAIRRQLRDAFYVDEDDWKERVYGQARDAAMKAVARLSGRGK